eukprot:TRINITY_DN11698_c0_g1_i2.p1 TRINITY_DN11698_c0_g1~~TRINITY_DN11698_c0_g1_i2.p1  ORF type:complete len:114 (-),score=6.33 TRINITY_DN11698_c0_g1_i2:32-373(-)
MLHLRIPRRFAMGMHQLAAEGTRDKNLPVACTRLLVADKRRLESQLQQQLARRDGAELLRRQNSHSLHDAEYKNSNYNTHNQSDEPFSLLRIARDRRDRESIYIEAKERVKSH